MEEKTVRNREKSTATEEYVTRVQVEQMISERISALKIYVLESDITDVQDSVRAMVKQNSF